MTRPVIGICAAAERVAWGAWSELADLLPRSYSTAVQRAGGWALLLPVDAAASEDPDELLDLIDGLIIAGGCDIDPASYQAETHSQTVDTCPPRDAFELALARRALERDIPLLGICRGMQLLNIAAGGTLTQHLPDVVGHGRHRPTPGTYSDHEVTLEPGSLASRAAGGERPGVKSHHHQGVDAPGAGLIVSGRADDDTIEAIENQDRRFALGVLWHPEEDDASPLIESLVAAARSAPVHTQRAATAASA
jgi:putative glutamine amidotransferase